MKYNSLWGYKDAAGLSAPELIFGFGQDDKIFKAIEDAQDRHIFPSGFKRIALFGSDRPVREIDFISEDVAKTAQNNDRLVKELEAKRRAQAQAERDAARNFTLADRLFRQMAQKRNSAVGKLAAEQARLTAPGLDDKGKVKQIEIIAAAKAENDKAIEEFNAILEQCNIIRNPKSKPEQKQAAYIALGVIKPISAPNTEAANTTTTIN